jgi:hypothetical protein
MTPHHRARQNFVTRLVELSSAKIAMFEQSRQNFPLFHLKRRNKFQVLLRQSTLFIKQKSTSSIYFTG